MGFILLFFLGSTSQFSCDSSSQEENSNGTRSDSIKEATVTTQLPSDTLACEGLENYVEANRNYLQSLRAYDEFSEEERSTLQEKVMEADKDFAQSQEFMSARCLHDFKLHSVQFTNEMREILMDDQPS